MPAALTPLANLTIGSDATSVTFSSISSAYKDLLLIMYAKPDFNGGPFVVLNATATTFTSVQMAGNGSSAVTGTNSTSDWPINIGSSSGGIYGKEWTSFAFHLMDYSATDKHKPILARYDNQWGSGTTVGRWTSTAAVTSLRLTMSPVGVTMLAGSTFALYGVSA
jgi:hypothetical protein